eukprot:1299086-Prymnesium_polylepis.1
MRSPSRRAWPHALSRGAPEFRYHYIRTPYSPGTVRGVDSPGCAVLAVAGCRSLQGPDRSSVTYFS